MDSLLLIMSILLMVKSLNCNEVEEEKRQNYPLQSLIPGLPQIPSLIPQAPQPTPSPAPQSQPNLANPLQSLSSIVPGLAQLPSLIPQPPTTPAPAPQPNLANPFQSLIPGLQIPSLIPTTTTASQATPSLASFFGGSNSPLAAFLPKLPSLLPQIDAQRLIPNLNSLAFPGFQQQEDVKLCSNPSLVGIYLKLFADPQGTIKLIHDSFDCFFGIKKKS